MIAWGQWLAGGLVEDDWRWGAGWFGTGRWVLRMGSARMGLMKE